jgi:hypothetical protein
VRHESEREARSIGSEDGVLVVVVCMQASYLPCPVTSLMLSCGSGVVVRHL